MVDVPNDYAVCRQRILERLKEPAPGRIQLLTGPRQVGKTTLLLEIAAQFGDAAVYAAGDEPDAALPGFWERRWAAAETQASHPQFERGKKQTPPRSLSARTAIFSQSVGNSPVLSKPRITSTPKRRARARRRTSWPRGG
jgi:hypothetical protein